MAVKKICEVNQGKGLANQQRRAQAIGAEIMLHSSDAGTVLTLRLPEKRLQA